MPKGNTPGSGATEENMNNFEKFMRWFAPPKEESASPYVSEGVYTDPFTVPESLQYKIRNAFTFQSPDDIAEDVRRRLKNKENAEGGTTDKLDPSKVPSFKDVMGMDVGAYMNKVSQVGERAKNKDALRAGISNLAMSPLIGGQAAMEAARNVMNLTGTNMAAMANQNQVLASNPTKQKIAGRYFRL